MPAAQDELFAGRDHEQKAFRAAIQQSRQNPPSTATVSPHIFVVYSRPGMGKSALLRQFQRIAEQEQLPAQQVIRLNLDHGHYPHAADLAEKLADALRPLQASSTSQYRQLTEKQALARPMYRKLKRGWRRWTALRSLGESEVDQLLLTRYQHVRTQAGITAARQTLHGPRHQVTPVAAQTDRVIDDLGDILFYRDAHSGVWPATFNQLLTDCLPAAAPLFQSPAGLGHALAEDLNTLAQSGPLIVMLDGYERAIQHDDWLREELLARLDNRVLVVLAGRFRPSVGYQRIFSAAQAQRVCECDLNQPLDQNEIKGYLTTRLGRDSDLAEVEGISHGSPLVVAALCDQLQLEGQLGPYRGMPAAENSIERTIVQRFLRPTAAQRALPNAQLISLRDRQRIRSLALLLRSDQQLICELWAVTAGEASAIMRELASRYSFIFAGCAPYDMSELVREFVREETHTRTRHSLEWPALAAGVQRGLTLVQEIAAHAYQKLDERCYDDPAWCAATLDQLNFLLWLGQSDAAQRLLLKHSIAARCAGSAFGDWLLTNAAALAPKTADWTRLVAALQTRDYDLLDGFANRLDGRGQAILCSMQARRWQLEVATAATAKQLDTYIDLLLKGSAADPTWQPLQDALVEARSARGHYRLYELHDYAAALADFSAILELRRADPSALCQRGAAYEALGQLEAALADFSQALERTSDAATLYGRGTVNHKLGRLDEACADFGQALTFGAYDPVVLSARGRVLFDQHKLQEALQDLNMAIALQQADPDIWIDRSRVLAAIGQTEKALDDIDTAITLRKDDPIAFKQRGIYKRINDLGGAELALDAAIKLFQEKPETLLGRGDLPAEHSEALYHRGLVHMSRAEPQQAMDTFNAAIALHDNPNTRYERALLWEARAQPPADLDAISQARHSALADLNAALSQQPGHAPALAKRGMILLMLGQPLRALDDLQAARSLRPNDLETINALGRAHMRLAEQAKALDEFRYSLLLDRNQPEALADRGRILADQGKLDQALQDLKDALDLRPDHIPTLYQRGLVYFKKKDFVAAEQDIQDVCNQHPGNLRAHELLGRIRLASGKARAAERDFNLVVSQQPDNVEARYRRGIARLRQNKLSAIPDLSIGTGHKIRHWIGKLKIEN